MRCPFCTQPDDKVIDSRTAREGEVIRRRRVCLRCKRRFTTYERIEDNLPVVVKKDNRREAFDRRKIMAGLKKACEKRPISSEVLETAVDRIEKHLQNAGESETPAGKVGDAVMQELRALDQVAYVRFASVYREFKDIDQFMETIQSLAREKGKP